MPKVTSWGKGVDSGLADAEGTGFTTYDLEKLGLPPKGTYRFRMKLLKLKMNKNGEPMLNALFEIEEPAKVAGKANTKAKYNGYGMWWNGNVTPQGAGFVNNFLDAFKFNRKMFWNKELVHDNDGEPAVSGASYIVGNVTSVSKKKVPEDGLLLKISLIKDKPYQGEERMKPAAFLPIGASDKYDTADEEDEIDDDTEEEYEEEEEEEEAEESEEDTDDEEGDEEISEEEEELRDELEELTLAALKKTAKADYGASLKDYRGMEKEELIEWIVTAAFEEDEEEEEAEEEPEDAEEEEEEEEPPAKPARRTRAAAAKSAPAKAAPARRSKAGSGVKYSKEPPFHHAPADDAFIA